MPDLLLAVADDGSRNPGPIPLFLVLLLLVAVVLLVRNMNGRLRRLPPSFPDQRDGATPRTDDDGRA